MTRLHFVLCLLFTPLLMGADDTGCQSESASVVDQERIHTAYWTLYDVETDTTYARAQFRLGSNVGTTLILDGAASVSFNGLTMGFNELLDWHEVEIPGQVDQGTYVFIDNDGNQFVNDMPAFATAEMPGSFPAALGSESVLVEWDGEPVADDDSVAVIVAHAANRFDFARFETRAVGGTSVVVDAGGLDRVARGAAVAGIHRNRRFPLADSPGAGGDILMTYQSAELTVDLE